MQKIGLQWQSDNQRQKKGQPNNHTAHHTTPHLICHISAEKVSMGELETVVWCVVANKFLEVRCYPADKLRARGSGHDHLSVQKFDIP
jgi:hypothetical protein